MSDLPDPVSAMGDDDRLKAAWSQLTLVLSFFSRIDTKLSVVLGLNLGMLAVIATRLPERENLTFWHGAFSAATFIPLALSLYHLYQGAFPSTQGGSTSTVYFGRIAAMSESEFLSAYKSRTADALADDVLEQVWRNSKILAAKFSSLQKAYRLLIAASVPWAGLLAFVSLT